MSYEEEPKLEAPSLSKVKLTRNAKGDPQWEITVVENTTPAEIERLRQIAVAAHNALINDLLPV